MQIQETLRHANRKGVNRF